MIADVPALIEQFAAVRGATVHRVRQQDIEPIGDGFIVGVSADLHGPNGIRSTDIYVNTASNAPHDERSLRAERPGGGRAVVWEHPADPALPALTAMSFPEAAGQTLAKFGIEASGAVLTLEAYRPGKRAVFRIDTDAGRFFAKIVPPSTVAEIDSLHRAFLAAGVPVPVSLGYADSGLLLLTRLAGESAASRIRQIAAAPGFLDSLTALSNAMAEVPLTRLARPSLASRVDWYGDRMREQAPRFAPGTDALIPLIAHRYAATRPGPPVTIHGDLHLGQLFVEPADPTSICGVLDIDTAGLGDPADDRGALYGHVRVSALQAGQSGDAAGAQSYAALASAISGRFDGSRVLAIAATHLLGHALAAASRGTETGNAVAHALLTEAHELVG